ncbi:hypothetical protein [Yoonia sp.]|uniref:hypothetical protein n=1 Tax=Yoonia sp. TaxID=2212373 RepID=UPI003F6D3CD3
MNEMNETGAHCHGDAAARVAEISGLFVSIRQILAQMIDGIGVPDARTPKTIIAKLSELQSAHLKVLAAEEAFHAQQDAVGGADTIDMETIRADIRGQLDRIRAAQDAGPLSGGAE